MMRSARAPRSAAEVTNPARSESGVDEAVVKELKRRGHIVEVEPGDYGGYQAIMWDPVNRVYHGVSEMRKDGMAVGY